MKCIIKGRLYNTDTAIQIGSYEYSNPRDFHYLSEELYQKNNGEFFLCGKGGPLSKYSKQVGISEWSSGEGIIPLTVEEAKEWGEAHLEVEDFIEAFGEPEE